MTFVECAICGEDLPADLVDTTTADTISPMQATMCKVCQHVQDFSFPEDRCTECGDAVDDGHYFEVEFPLGVADLPARLAGTLCGDCAADHAFRIYRRRVEADDEAHERHLELYDQQNERRRELGELT